MNTFKQSNQFMLYLMAFSILINFIIGAFFWEEFSSLPNWAQIVAYQVLVFLVPCLFVAVKFQGKLRGIFPVKGIDIKNAVMIIGICLLIQPAMMLISLLSTVFSENTVGEAVGDMLTDGGLVLTLGVFAVVPSVFEELACRGPALSGYSKLVENKRSLLITAIVINGIFFGMMHLNPQQFFYTAVLGSLFSIFVIYTKSLIAPILGHFVINGGQSALLAWAMQETGGYDVYAEAYYYQAAETTIEISYTTAMISLLIFVGVTLWFAIRILKAFIKRNTMDTVKAGEIDCAAISEARTTTWKNLITWELVMVAVLYGLMMLLFFVSMQ